MAARNEVKPLMYPVLAAEIEMLEANRAVPDGLKRFWLANGCGMFNEETSGRTILQGAENNLLGPNEILSVFGRSGLR
jgi:hypothetical protein